MKITWVLSIVLLFQGCSSGKFTHLRHHEDGRQKPTVTFAPVRLSSAAPESLWDIQEEWGKTIQQHWLKTGQLFVRPLDESGLLVNYNDWFGADLRFAEPFYRHSQFLVFVNIIEHSALPYLFAQERVSDLQQPDFYIIYRFRVLDLRYEKPTVILQELIKRDFSTPNHLQGTDYANKAWGTANYWKSSLAKAHKEVTRYIAQRSERYILSACGIEAS